MPHSFNPLSQKNVFQNMRLLLSKKASNGLLTVSQTIGAKKIIHDLNRDVVRKMSTLLNIHEDTMAPEELIKLITELRNNGSLEDGVEKEIKHVVYVEKIKALKQLISILNISKSDNELTIPSRTPDDLIDALFSKTLDMNEVKGKTLIIVLEGAT